jgi:hypothetical protein
VLLNQFHETAQYRGWRVLAVAVMTNRFHLVVGVPGDPNPTKVLGDFKAYGSRALNARWGKPASGTWWTYDGSKRKLPDEAALRAAIAYVRSQFDPLVIWADPEFSDDQGRAGSRQRPEQADSDDEERAGLGGGPRGVEAGGGGPPPPPGGV